MIFDLAIVGSGFGGSLLAMIARRLGKSVVLIEKGKHPRVVVGESSTPMANLMLEELADRYDLPRIRSFSKWGTWQRDHPEIGCGLKRGFTFYHHNLNQPQPPDPERRDQLLVEASPHDSIADTHWYRADFDLFFVEEAVRMGVEYFDETNLLRVEFSETAATLRGEKQTWRARFVIDATGPRGFLHRALGLGESSLPALPQTQALYSHFSGVRKLDSPSNAPYPVNDAAVHHVFDGGWIWVLQFNNGITSAGVAADERLDLHQGGSAWQSLIDRIPAVREQFREAVAQRPFTFIPRLPFRSANITGQRWALLPSAAGFVDPLLSTGFPLTLAGVARLGALIETGFPFEGVEEYAAETEADLLAAARLVAALYANMADFQSFTALSLLYFAAVTFSETSRRLGTVEGAGSFLMRDREPFGLAAADLLSRAATRAVDPAEIAELIEPINIAGLADTAKKNWYAVDVGDLYASASRLGVTHQRIGRMIEMCGLNRFGD